MLSRPNLSMATDAATRDAWGAVLSLAIFASVIIAKRLSALDAAAIVLAKSGKPMKAKDMIEAMASQGLWSSPGGKTPEATLYAAVIREIATKKHEARFKKHDRGLFIATHEGA